MTTAPLPPDSPPSGPDAAAATSADGESGDQPAPPAHCVEPPIGTPGEGSDKIPNLHLSDLLHDLLAGLGFFTRLPVRAPNVALAQAAMVFSAIGALIGFAATLFYVLGLWIGLSSLMAAALAAAVIAGLVGGPGAAFVSTLSALVVGFIIAHLAYRQVGGYTGDVLGAAEQLVEVTVMMNFVSFT